MRTCCACSPCGSRRRAIASRPSPRPKRAHPAHIERPQLVLSDVRLPGRDGLALFDEIRQRHPSLPVILLTAHGTIPDAVEATERGVFTYLTKPYDGKGLLDKIAQALALSAPATRPKGAAPKPGKTRSSAAPAAWPSAGRGAHGGASPTPACCCAAKAAPARSCWPSAIHKAGARARQALHRGQLRRHSRSPARVRAVRPRQGRLHRRGGQPQGPVPGGRRRHAAARRNR
jgi:CheY-like chemotaxis protein